MTWQASAVRTHYDENLREEALPTSRAARGAREVEAVARNPRCAIPAMALMTGASLGDAARRIGLSEPDRQSPHALRHGIRFEARALADRAAAVVELYQREGVLDEGVIDVMELGVPQNASPQHAIEARRAAQRATAAAITAYANGDSAPHVIVQGCLTLEQLGGIVLVPDLLIAEPGQRHYRPVDLKSFPDLGGRTDRAALRGGRRQLAVYWLALERTGTLQASDVPRGDLLLSRPGSYRLSLSSEHLTGEVHTMRDVLSTADRSAEALIDVMRRAGHAKLDSLDALAAASPAWMPSCGDHCSLHRACESRARQGGDPLTVDARARTHLGTISSLGQYQRMMDRLEQPDDQQQAMVIERHRAYLDLFARTTGI